MVAFPNCIDYFEKARVTGIEADTRRRRPRVIFTGAPLFPAVFPTILITRRRPASTGRVTNDSLVYKSALIIPTSCFRYACATHRQAARCAKQAERNLRRQNERQGGGQTVLPLLESSAAHNPSVRRRRSLESGSANRQDTIVWRGADRGSERPGFRKRWRYLSSYYNSTLDFFFTFCSRDLPELTAHK